MLYFRNVFSKALKYLLVDTRNIVLSYLIPIKVENKDGKWVYTHTQELDFCTPLIEYNPGPRTCRIWFESDNQGCYWCQRSMHSYVFSEDQSCIVCHCNWAGTTVTCKMIVCSVECIFEVNKMVTKDLMPLGATSGMTKALKEYEMRELGEYCLTTDGGLLSVIFRMGTWLVLDAGVSQYHNFTTVFGLPLGYKSEPVQPVRQYGRKYKQRR